MALLRYLWPSSVDVPSPLARRAAVEPREPVRGQGRRGSGGRCPVADPRAKLRAPRGDIFPAGPPAPAAARGGGVGPGTGGDPRTPPSGAPRLAGGGVTSHPGRRGHRRCGNLSVAEERGLAGPPPRAPRARSGRAGRRRPRAVAETTPAPGTCGRPCQAPGAPPGEPSPGQTCYSRFLPLRSGEEWVRRGRAAAPRSPPSRGRTGPAAGGAGACPGMAGRPPSAQRPEGEGRATRGKGRPLALGRPEHGAELGPARPSSLTPGDPAFRRATAALAQAIRPSGCVTVTGRLGQRAVEGERGASPFCLGGGCCALWGVGGGHYPPGRGGGGPPAQLAGEGRGHRGEVCVCVRARACGRGGRAEEDPGLRAGASSGSGPSPGRRP